MSNSVFQLLPVLDLMGGKAVHAVRGIRSNYQPLLGRYASSPYPDTIFTALEQAIPSRQAYVADLDQIKGIGSNSHLLNSAISRGWKLWLDAGLTTTAPPPQTGIVQVAGTETVQSPSNLAKLIVGQEKEWVISVDLRAGLPIHANRTEWPDESPKQLLQRVVEMGAKRIILLDLAVVGSNEGPSHLPLAEECKQANPEVEIFLGGGIRGPADLFACQKAGISGALVATALHSGALDSWLNKN
jgi:phosphoribosylformimino-5-aminoimidazole carboxamide ribotide isomerase